MNEADLEILTLDWLAELGYECLTGEDISPGGKLEVRSNYRRVVLRPRLAEALRRLNPRLPASALDAAADRLASYGNQSSSTASARCTAGCAQAFRWKSPTPTATAARCVQW